MAKRKMQNMSNLNFKCISRVCQQNQRILGLNHRISVNGTESIFKWRQTIWEMLIRNSCFIKKKKYSNVRKCRARSRHDRIDEYSQQRFHIGFALNISRRNVASHHHNSNRFDGASEQFSLFRFCSQYGMHGSYLCVYIANARTPHSMNPHSSASLGADIVSTNFSHINSTLHSPREYIQIPDDDFNHSADCD